LLIVYSSILLSLAPTHTNPTLPTCFLRHFFAGLYRKIMCLLMYISAFEGTMDPFPLSTTALSYPIQSTKHFAIYLFDLQLPPIHHDLVQPSTATSSQRRSQSLALVLRRVTASSQNHLESHPGTHLSSCLRNQSFVNSRPSPSASVASISKVQPFHTVKDSNGHFFAKRSNAFSLVLPTQSCHASGATQ
jgi:hypothetical protein